MWFITNTLTQAPNAVTAMDTTPPTMVLMSGVKSTGAIVTSL
jgi:hypothetical protein